MLPLWRLENFRNILQRLAHDHRETNLTFVELVRSEPLILGSFLCWGHPSMPGQAKLPAPPR